MISEINLVSLPTIAGVYLTSKFEQRRLRKFWKPALANNNGGIDNEVNKDRQSPFSLREQVAQVISSNQAYQPE